MNLGSAGTRPAIPPGPTVGPMLSGGGVAAPGSVPDPCAVSGSSTGSGAAVGVSSLSSIRWGLVGRGAWVPAGAPASTLGCSLLQLQRFRLLRPGRQVPPHPRRLPPAPARRP